MDVNEGAARAFHALPHGEEVNHARTRMRTHQGSSFIPKHCILHQLPQVAVINSRAGLHAVSKLNKPYIFNSVLPVLSESTVKHSCIIE